MMTNWKSPIFDLLIDLAEGWQKRETGHENGRRGSKSPEIALPIRYALVHIPDAQDLSRLAFVREQIKQWLWELISESR